MIRLNGTRHVQITINHGIKHEQKQKPKKLKLNRAGKEELKDQQTELLH